MKSKQKTKHLESQYIPKPAKKSRGQWQLHGDDLTQDLNTESTSLTSSEENNLTEAGIPQYHIYCLVPGETLEGNTMSSQQQAREPSETHKYQEHAPEPPKMASTYNQAEEISSVSEYFSCVSSPDKFNLFGRKKIQKFLEGAPEPLKMTSTCNQAAEENSSESKYFSCVSSPEKLKLLDKKSKYFEMPLTQDSEKWESLSPFPCLHISWNLASEPPASSASKKKERVMKVHYMYVRMKKGVAVLLEDEEDRMPRKKKRKMKMETIAFPETIHTKISHSEVSTCDLLTEDELGSDDESQEEREEAEIPEEPSPLEEGTRAQTPEWLVAMDKGYRCLGCCRIFSTLESLQHHVEHGVEEGFSCRTFHLSLAWLQNKYGKKEEEEEKKKNKKSKHAS